MTTNNNTVKYRVGRLENDVEEIRTDVKKILNNHLPHLSESVSGIRTQVKLFGTIILGALGAMIALFIGRVL